MAISYSKQKQIAQRYAQAGFALAAEQGKAAPLSESFQALKAAYGESAELRSVVKNPMIPLAELKAAFDAILKKLKADKIAADLINHILEQGRGALIPMIADSLQEKCDAAEGINRVEVTSATPLSDAELKQIAESLGAKTQVSNKVDESLIGGVILRQGSRMLDASIAGRLRRLENQLTDTRIETA